MTVLLFASCDSRAEMGMYMVTKERKFVKDTGSACFGKWRPHHKIN